MQSPHTTCYRWQPLFRRINRPLFSRRGNFSRTSPPPLFAPLRSPPIVSKRFFPPVSSVETQTPRISTRSGQTRAKQESEKKNIPCGAWKDLIRATDTTTHRSTRTERAGFPLTLQGFRPRQFVVIRVACIDRLPGTSGYFT